MIKSNITISDIAERAGVSKATVSRVLNTPDIVEKHTREKVIQIMKELHYYIPVMIMIRNQTTKHWI